MFTFSKPIGEINEQDLLALIDGGVIKNRQLEYKRDLPGTIDKDKRKFVRDVVAFANSAGGHILIGIAQSKGLPTEFAPISGDKIDSAKLQLESIIRTSIEPAIQGLKIDSVKLSSGHALIIEIPRGLFGLHMIKNRGAFIARTSAGNSELDVNEIRAAFVGAEAAIARLSEFRADRPFEQSRSNAISNAIDYAKFYSRSHKSSSTDWLKGFMDTFCERFAQKLPADYKRELLNVIGDNDMVVVYVRQTWTGRDGQHHQALGFDMFRVKDGMIAEHWDAD